MNVRKECNRLDKLVLNYEYKLYVTHCGSSYKLSKKMKRIFKKYNQLWKLRDKFLTNLFEKSIKK
jgi:hypothetical protein